jgi:hypothetical protein
LGIPRARRRKRAKVEKQHTDEGKDRRMRKREHE